MSEVDYTTPISVLLTVCYSREGVNSSHKLQSRQQLVNFTLMSKQLLYLAQVRSINLAQTP